MTSPVTTIIAVIAAAVDFFRMIPCFHVYNKTPLLDLAKLSKIDPINLPPPLYRYQLSCVDDVSSSTTTGTTPLELLGTCPPSDYHSTITVNSDKMFFYNSDVWCIDRVEQ